MIQILTSSKKTRDPVFLNVVGLLSFGTGLFALILPIYLPVFDLSPLSMLPISLVGTCLGLIASIHSGTHSYSRVLAIVGIVSSILAIVPRSRG